MSTAYRFTFHVSCSIQRRIHNNNFNRRIIRCEQCHAIKYHFPCRRRATWNRKTTQFRKMPFRQIPRLLLGKTRGIYSMRFLGWSRRHEMWQLALLRTRRPELGELVAAPAPGHVRTNSTISWNTLQNPTYAIRYTTIATRERKKIGATEYFLPSANESPRGLIAKRRWNLEWWLKTTLLC